MTTRVYEPPQESRRTTKDPESDEFYLQHRKLAFGALKDVVAHEVLDMANYYQTDAKLGWSVESGGDGERVYARVESVGDKLAKDQVSYPVDMFSGQLPESCSEAIAKIALFELQRTRQPGAKTRFGEIIAESELAAVAFFLLQDLDALPPNLLALVRALLGQDALPLKLSKDFDALNQASWIWAQTPDMGVNELARVVGVAPSTVSRWTDKDYFNNLVRRRRKLVETMKSIGRWPDQDEDS